MEKLKNVYVVWFDYHQNLPKTHKHSIGQRVDNMLVESIESVATATFLVKQEKLPYVRRAMQKIDTVKILLLILWETKSLDNKKYITISQKIDEIGRMLGGWNGQLIKQNSLDFKPREK